MNRGRGRKRNAMRRPIEESFVSAGFEGYQSNVEQKDSQQDVDINKQQQEHKQDQLIEIKDEVDLVSENGNDGNTSDGDEGKRYFKKIFVTRKKSSIRAREKKIRQNRQLRKTILPKNALMALNEIKGILISDFNIVQTEGGFMATMTVNGSQYQGKGVSKVAAKNSACEKALRDFVLAKMAKHPRIPRTPLNNSKSVNDSIVEDPEAMNTLDSLESEMNGDEADDIPMVNLASFAIYKLFSEWEKDGFSIPDMHPVVHDTSIVVEPKAPPKPTVRNELPSDHEGMHPATLLCIMRPGLTYSDEGTVGEMPNVMHKVKCVVDEQEFSACGRSKKLARRTCAAGVCNTLFGTNFNLTDE